MSDYRLDPNDNINVSEILDDLEPLSSAPPWVDVAHAAPGLKLGQFTYEDCSEPLKSSVPPAAGALLWRYRPAAAAHNYNGNSIGPL